MQMNEHTTPSPEQPPAVTEAIPDVERLASPGSSRSVRDKEEDASLFERAAYRAPGMTSTSKAGIGAAAPALAQQHEQRCLLRLPEFALEAVLDSAKRQCEIHR